MTDKQDREAVVYVRVSTAEQANEGVSLAAQTAKARAWCELNGVTIAATHTDAGLSGKRADNRPALQQALADVVSRRGVLVVYSLSRLSRSTRDAITISEQLAKAGADLASLTEAIDTSTASGRAFFTIMAAMAQLEREQLGERTRAAMQHKKSKLERVGAVPFGFDLDDDGVHLTPNTQEQEIIGLIHQLRSEGYSLRAIADELTRRDIATKEGKRTSWHYGSVRRILDRQNAA